MRQVSTAEKPKTIPRTDLVFRVLPVTRERLLIQGAILPRGNRMSPGNKAVEILDAWADSGALPPDVEKRSKLPAPYSVRRLQVTGWVKKSTSLAIRRVALELDLSDSALAGVICDLWAESLAVAVIVPPSVKVTSREKLRGYQKKWREKKRAEKAEQAGL